MFKLTKKQQNLLAMFLKETPLQSSEVHGKLSESGSKVSLVTVKRGLSELAQRGFLSAIGSGRTAGYDITVNGRLFSDIDARQYCLVEPDKRYGLKRYNFELVKKFPSEIFTENEQKILEQATLTYKERTDNLSVTIQKKELERFIIELSWKSSKIEGNTYTLLDTEKLILENKEAPGHDKNEARMILNHKNAFNFIHENLSRFRTVTRKNLEELHAIIVADLSVDFGLRKKPVGVIGSIYQPLDNAYQISEAVETLSEKITEIDSPYTKVLFSLLGLSYIQPFEDGNKRTSRLMGNALLLAHGLAPLSYRSVDEAEYRESILVFYEINSVVPFKKIFIEQYNFAALNYGVR